MSASSVAPARTTRFARQVLVRTLLVGLAAFAALFLLAPWALLFDPTTLPALGKRGGLTAIAALIGTIAACARVLRSNRYVLRSLALGSAAVEPADIGALADLPFALTLRFMTIGGLGPVLLLVPGIRPVELDLARGISLCLLTWTLILAAGVVHYVVVRAATLQVLELSPIEPITEWLENPAARLAPMRRVTRKILVAIVAPVALVGVGTVLVTHAHLRSFVEQHQMTTAIIMARASLAPGPGALPDVGRRDALAVAREYGYWAWIERGEGDALGSRAVTEQPEVVVPLADGRAVVRYDASLSPIALLSGTLVALIAVLLAAGFGRAFGRALGKDLLLATEQVSSLGTERALRGQAEVAGPARFQVVAELGFAVEALAERFRVFARAQERAIGARERARRMRQLLFASVSHDLKSPLNAILGFADLLLDEPLSPAQAESLDMVVSRGRELLALIETILDAARVEAGGLELLAEATAADRLLGTAMDTARDLHTGSEVDVAVELQQPVPTLMVDAAYAARSLAVIVSHAMQTANRETGIRIGCEQSEQTDPSGRELARVWIEYAADSVAPELLAAQLRGRSPSSVGRGVALRLGLARSLIELHGGHVEVERSPQGTAKVVCWLPRTQRDHPDTGGQC